MLSDLSTTLERMAEKRSEIKRHLDSTGETVQSNLRRIREEQRMPVTELSERMAALGRPIPVLGLRRIEAGDRRVDVDDLVALALALGISPIGLLMPDTKFEDQLVRFTGVEGRVEASRLWEWLQSDNTLEEEPYDRWILFLARSWPTWLVGEKFDEHKLQQALRARHIHPDQLEREMSDGHD